MRTMQVQRSGGREASYLPLGESSVSEAVCHKSGFLLGEFFWGFFGIQRVEEWCQRCKTSWSCSRLREIRPIRAHHSGWGHVNQQECDKHSNGESQLNELCLPKNIQLNLQKRRRNVFLQSFRIITLQWVAVEGGVKLPRAQNQARSKEKPPVSSPL